MTAPPLVSVHGGHSGEFCSHACDSLEQVVGAYEDRGFAWAGLTEHMPPARTEMLPDEERAAGLDVAAVRRRFAGYFERARELQASLIRLLDPDYPDRWRERVIWERIERNLHLVRELDLILDFNVRALAKGQSEPYISGPILTRARELGIAVVPGDDSHGVDGVGLGCEDGIRLLVAAGFSTDWRRPV